MMVDEPTIVTLRHISLNLEEPVFVCSFKVLNFDIKLVNFIIDVDIEASIESRAIP